MNESTWTTKVGLARMLRGGVIMDVVDAEQARIAEDAGASAVMALERVPAQIRAEGGVARASDPAMIRGIQEAVSIPVMAKCRIGHVIEARILEALEVDFVDESEVLTPADERHHVDKRAFRVPFVCGATNLGEALRRIAEGAAMIRTKGEAGTGDISQAVRHLREVNGAIRRLAGLGEEQLVTEARELGAPLDLVRNVAREGRLPVPQFAAGGIATPADAALAMLLGAEAVFVGSGIFLSADPPRRARAIVGAVTHWEDAAKLAEISEGLGEAMRGTESARLDASAQLAGARLVMRIGVLALQGGFAMHLAALRAIGHDAIEVRRARELDGCEGLVLPGGESGAQLRLLDRDRELERALDTMVRGGAPVLATCAGLILAAREVRSPAQRSFGWIDVVVRRNAWGRQLKSGEAIADDGTPLVLIRAPRVEAVGPRACVELTLSGEPVLVREGRVFGATFHPELGGASMHARVFGAS